MQLELKDYSTYKKYSLTKVNIAALPERERLRFYNTIMQTFDMLRTVPKYKDFLNNQNVRQTIADEGHKWMTERWYRGNKMDGKYCETWFGQFAAIKGVENRIVSGWDSSENMWMRRLLGNIHCVNALCFGIVRSPSAASNAARNAFDLGWEHTLLAFVCDLEKEVLMRKPKNYLFIHSFLLDIEREIHAVLQNEEDVNSTAVMALYRLGLDTEIIRMIIPCKVRFMGVPLALMPACFLLKEV
jgi:hypothetical protein